jgi:hypothetical protein
VLEASALAEALEVVVELFTAVKTLEEVVVELIIVVKALDKVVPEVEAFAEEVLA